MLLTRTIRLVILAVVLLLSCPAHASIYDDAVARYNSKNFKDAIELFRKAQAEGQQAANAAYYEALCYHRMRQTARAIKAYKLVLKRYPRSSAARQARAILAKAGHGSSESTEVEKAKKFFEKEFESLPEVVEVRYRTGFNSQHMFVNATINGIRTRVIFDTGAEITVCKASFLNAIGVRVGKTIPAPRMRGVGGEVNTRVAMVRMGVGNLERTLPLYIEQDQSYKAAGKKDFNDLPLLGQSFFKDFSFSIDDQRKIITFTKLDKAALASKKKQPHSRHRKYSSREVPFQRMGNNMLVTARINGRECEMIFDTGASTLAFSDRHLAQYGINRPTSAREGQVGGVGGRNRGFSFYLKSVALGPIEKRNVQAMVMLQSTFPKPLLGQTFLRGLKYTIDPVKEVIRFE